MNQFGLRIQQLREHGYVYEAKNNGQHLVILLRGGKVDYWPSSGKWHDHASGERGECILRLYAILGARRNGDEPPVAATVVERTNVGVCVIDEAGNEIFAARIKELERVLHTVYVNNELSISDNELIERTLPNIEKLTAEAHSTKLPWD